MTAALSLALPVIVLPFALPVAIIAVVVTAVVITITITITITIATAIATTSASTSTSSTDSAIVIIAPAVSAIITVPTAVPAVSAISIIVPAPSTSAVVVPAASAVGLERGQAELNAEVRGRAVHARLDRLIARRRAQLDLGGRPAGRIGFRVRRSDGRPGGRIDEPEHDDRPGDGAAFMIECLHHERVTDGVTGQRRLSVARYRPELHRNAVVGIDGESEVTPAARRRREEPSKEWSAHTRVPPEGSIRTCRPAEVSDRTQVTPGRTASGKPSR